jgi:hypothetical protein
LVSLEPEDGLDSETGLPIDGVFPYDKMGEVMRSLARTSCFCKGLKRMGELLEKGL